MTTLHFANVERNSGAFCGWPGGATTSHFQAVTCLECLRILKIINGPKLVEKQERSVWHERLQRGLDAIAYVASACPYCGSVLILRVDLSGWSGWCWPCPCRRDHRVTYQAAMGAWVGPQSGVARVTGVGISGPALVIYADDQWEAP